MNTPPLPLTVPRHWSPEQALAVWETLSELADLVWAQYEVSLIELCRYEQQLAENTASDQFDLFAPDDSIPF